MNAQSEYPWSESASGLCKYLRRPEIWSRAFSKDALGSATDVARKDVKRIAKKHAASLSIPNSIHIHDDDCFGSVVAAILSQRTARNSLFQILNKKLLSRDGRSHIAQAVNDYANRFDFESGLRVNDTKGWAQSFQENCKTRTKVVGKNKLKFLVKGCFFDWLATLENLAEYQEVEIATFGCAWAILQPEMGEEIREALTAWKPGLLEQTTSLPAEEIPPDHTQTQTGVEKASTSEVLKPSQGLTLAETPVENQVASIASACANLATLLHGDTPVDHMTVAEAREFYEQLKETGNLLIGISGILSDREQKIKQQNLELKEKLTAISSPLLPKQVILSKLLPQLEDKSLVTIPEILERTAKQIAGISLLTEKYESLSKRIGSPVHQVISADSLDSLVTRLREVVSECEFELRVRSARIKVRRSLFSRVHIARPGLRTFLVDEASTKDLVDCASSLFRDNDLPKHFEVRTRARLAGLIAVKLYARGEDKTALDLLIESITTTQEDVLADLICLLTKEQLLSLHKRVPALSLYLCDQLFLATAVDSRFDRFESFEQIFTADELPGVYREFFREIIDQWRRNSLTSIRRVVRASQQKTSITTTTDLQMELESFLDGDVGLHGLYAKLRRKVQHDLIDHLGNSVRTADSNAVNAARSAMGDHDEIVDRAVKSLPGTEVRSIENSHRKQTLKYLSQFDKLLEDWTAEKNKTPHNDKCIVAVRRLRDAAETDKDASRLYSHLIDAIRPESDSLFVQFGERQIEDEIYDVPWHIDNTMPLSWPDAKEGRPQHLAALICDHICFGETPPAERLNRAARDYLANDDLICANAIKDEVGSDVRIRILDAIRLRQSKFLESQAHLIDEANSLRTECSDIDNTFQEIERHLEMANFREAEEWVLILEDYISQHRDKNDPRRLELQDLLKSAGEEPNANASMDTLQLKWDETKSKYRARRLHIEEMQKIITHTNCPDWLKDEWSELVRAIDTPEYWPDHEHAHYVSEAIPRIGMYLIGKSTTPDESTLNHITLASSVIRGLLVELSSNPDKASQVLDELAEMIGRMLPERRIEEFLKPHLSSRQEEIQLRVIASDREPAFDSHARRSLPRVERDDSQEKAAQTVREVVMAIKNIVSSEHPHHAPESSLTDLLQAKRWKEVREILAGRLVATPDEEGQQICQSIIMYAIAILMSDLPTDSQSLSICCLAACLNQHSGYPSQTAIARAFVSITNRQIDLDWEKADLGASVNTAISSLFDMNDYDSVWNTFRQLLLKGERLPVGAENASLVLLTCIWDSLKGIKDNNEPRSKLLMIVYKLRRHDLLRQLCTKLGRPGPAFSHCVDVCFLAERQGDDASDVRMMQNILALENNFSGQRNTRPWLQFFRQLLVPTKNPLGFRLESKSLYSSGDRQAFFELVLCPMRARTIDHLKLHLGGLNNNQQSSFSKELVSPETPLLTERAVRVDFPLDLALKSGNKLTLAYRFDGIERISEQKVVLSGDWEFDLENKSNNPLDETEIRSGWPGARGKTVKRGSGFYGRYDEISQLESFVVRTDSPQSVMVFGQRRIGKSSLLRDLLESAPPSQGRTCAIYSSLDEMSLDGDLPTEFMRQILSSICRGDVNMRLWDAIRKQSSKDFDSDEKLLRRCRPDIKISEAFDKLLTIMRDASSGVVDRVVFLIDEFDRFVGPALGGRSDEVKQFMWGLRGITSTSDKISFVLAGTGLARIFLEDQDQALWESVATIELGSFKWPAERDAVRDTLLPQRFRDRICSPDVTDNVVERAYQLTGGNPYYLSMLGYALAQAGHLVTPATLATVMNRMVCGEVKGSVNIQAKSFYGFAFETFSTLPLLEQHLSKYLLAQIASQSTAEFPSVGIEDVVATARIDLPFIEESYVRDSVELLERDFLKINFDSETVEIGLPFMGAAIKSDSSRIIRESVRKLGNAFNA